MLIDQSASQSLASVQFRFGSNSAPSPLFGDNLGVGPLHIISAGNYPDAAGAGSRLITAPGTAKNAITVGATYTDNREPYTPGCPANADLGSSDYRIIAPFSRAGYPDAWAGLASAYGPRLPRIKPDLVAPGVRTYGRRSGATYFSGSPAGCNSNLTPEPPIGAGNLPGYNKYMWAAGTSFSNPLVSGAALVAREWLQASARNGSPIGIANPSPSVIRALLIATAKNLCPADNCLLPKLNQSDPNRWMRSAPDSFQGWGGVALDWIYLGAPYLQRHFQ